MSTSKHHTLSTVEERIGAEIWAERVASAEEEAVRLTRVLARVRGGESRRVALEAEALVPARPYQTMVVRLRRFEAGGRDALIDRRAPKARERKVTAEVRGAVRVLALSHPELYSGQLSDKLMELLGVRLSGTSMRELLSELGLSRSRGRPGGSGGGRGASEVETVTALPVAGAELLKAVEDEVGAVRALTQQMGEHIDALPAPEGPVLDDSAHRDEHGHFLPSYNVPKARTEPELGGKFDAAERRRGEKDLRRMRVANSSFEARYRKDLALMMLPLVVDTPRWSALVHWRGQHLETLVGYPYRAATLDKHARELKLSGAAETAREATASFWMEREGVGSAGGVVAYIDAATKPVWTHHFTRCAKVSSTGRLMPAMSTVWLNSGSGTPLVYRTFSGHTSVPRQVASLLEQVESAAGSGTTERLVVLDRESHAVWLFKELDAGGWQYIVPLRKTVTGDRAKFEDLGEWLPYGSMGDETREGCLWLNDSRAGEPRLRVRVVARRRHRTGKVAWYATNTSADLLDATTVIDRYFARWPLQEHVFRDGNGRVGLDMHHGYGKKKVTNVAVVSRLEQLEATLRRCSLELGDKRSERDPLMAAQQDWALAQADLRTLLAQASDTLDELVEAGQTDGPEFAEGYADLRRYQRWLDEATAEITRIRVAIDDVNGRIRHLEQRSDRATTERDSRAGKTTIFTVDTELDEIMTAYKLTFMNLARHLMTEHMEERMELDTLIQSVLTLPGERVVTETTETIRIYRQERDPRAMAAVERATVSLNKLGLTRGPPDRLRRLTLTLVDHPDRSSTGSG